MPAHSSGYGQEEGDGMLGALDLGGASTQITFIPSNGTIAPYLLRLYGRQYKVYTHSFLCYGKAEAERKYFSRLVKVSHGNSDVLHYTVRSNLYVGWTWGVVS